MAITKLKNNNYKLEVFYPKEVRQILGVTTERYRKTFRTKKAEQAEKDVSQKIQRVLNEKSARSFELNGHIKFKEFYETVWLDMYIACLLDNLGKYQLPQPLATRKMSSVFIFCRCLVNIPSSS